MGWTVLYIAFGIVALWLLGEVLLQYKARLRWRLLAFTGFLCVVAGALIPSVIVIGAGIAAFATGQTFVTLSYRRGFVAGWALNGIPGASRRREQEADDEAEFDGPPMPGDRDMSEPAAPAGRNGFGPDTFETGALGANGYGSNRYEGNGFGTGGYDADDYEPSAFETRSFAAADAFGGNGSYNGYDSAQPYEPVGYGQGGYEQNGYEQNGYGADPYLTATNGSGVQQPAQQQPVPVYQPGPMPDETGEFALGAYDSFGYPSSAQRGIYPEPAEQQQQYAAYSDPYYGYDGNSGYAGGSFDAYGTDGYGSGYGGIGEVPGYGPQQSPYGNGAAGGYGGEGYGTDAYGTNGYGTEGYGTDGYGMNGYGTDGYGTSYDMGGGTYGGEQSYFPQAPTDGGGVWVPQQRDPNDQPQPEPQPYPYQNGDPNGYGSQGNGYYY